MYSLFFGLGQLACSVGLQIVNVSTPYGYRNAFYSEFVLLGLFLPALVFAPESPCKSWRCAQFNVCIDVLIPLSYR
jgi:hypothetical protein